MRRVIRRAGRLGVLLALAAWLATPAGAATFLGLDSLTEDVINSVGFSLPSGGGDWDDAANELDIDGTALNIDAEETTNCAAAGTPACDNKILDATTSPLSNITGGEVDARLDLASESLTFFGNSGGADIFNYTATFTGRAGADDVKIVAPLGGPATEMDGRTLLTGELTSVATVSIDFAAILGVFAGSTNAAISGEFQVTGGDPTFTDSLFGMVGDLGDIIGTSSVFSVPLATILADGFLFSQRDDGSGGNPLATCPDGTLIPPGTILPCTSSVVGSLDFTFTGTGEVVPQTPAAFVPEPTTGLMLASALAGLGLAGRRRR